MQAPIRIELPTRFAMGTVNAYLFLEPEPVLVDCGEKTEVVWQFLEEALYEHNLRIKDLKKIYITHAHVDHIGMAGRIAEESEAEIWVSEYTYPWAVDFEKSWPGRVEAIRNTWQKGGAPSPAIEAIAQGVGNMDQFWQSVPAERTHVFKVGDYLPLGKDRWEVIYAPGHAVTQTCFYQKESRQLLSADMLLYITPTAIIEQNLAGTERERALPKMLESYQKFREMEIETVYPGHREIFQNHRALIDRQVSRIQQRKEECLEAVKSGHHQIFNIMQNLYEDANPALMFASFAMTRGYLDLLIDEGKVVEKEVEGVWEFQAT